MGRFQGKQMGLRIGVAVGIFCGVGLVSSPSHAQYAGSSQTFSTTDRETEEINNFLNGTGDGSAGSLFSVINRLQQLSGGMSGADFAAEQDETINSAVQDFRKKQQEKLRNQNPPSAPQGAPLTPAP
jgi:hypothetical protein